MYLVLLNLYGFLQILGEHSILISNIPLYLGSQPTNIIPHLFLEPALDLLYMLDPETSLQTPLEFLDPKFSLLSFSPFTQCIDTILLLYGNVEEVPNGLLYCVLYIYPFRLVL
jgi:hypothetical protein